MYGEGECFLKCTRFDNGFTVEIMDPAIVKYNNARDEKNRKRGDKDPYLDYKSPWKSMVFKTSKELVDFIAKNADKAVTAAKSKDDDGDYSTAWDMACTED